VTASREGSRCVERRGDGFGVVLEAPSDKEVKKQGKKKVATWAAGARGLARRGVALLVIWIDMGSMNWVFI